MSMTLSRRLFLAATAAFAATRPALAEEPTTHTVEMFTKHPDNKKLRNIFSPRVLRIKAGDTVDFVATEKSHDSVSLEDMIPEGGETWKGKVSKDVSVTLTVPGVYGYKCTPHYSLGMVGLIIVEGEGMMDNVEAARAVKHKGKAKKIFAEIWAEVDEQDLLAM